MKTKLVVLTCAAALQGSMALAQQFESKVAMTSNARQIHPPMVFPPAPINGSDTCATPDPITGSGPHSFDNTTATTGTDGQSTVNCIFSNQIGVANDVWFVWTAPASGTFEISTCGQTTVDTKIIVYLGSGCPAAGATAEGCSDDLNLATFPGNFQTRAVFAATSGTQYLVQLGEFPVGPFAPGTGTFRIDQQIVQDPFVRHDGTTENSSRATSATTLWMSALGNSTTGLRSVSAVRTAFGATPPGSNGVTNGNPTQVGVWEDPNDDGNPSDAILLATATGVVANEGTDTLNTYTLTTPVVVDKVFFVGAAYNHGVGVGFPVPFDVLGCESRAGQNWMIGNAATTVDFTNLATNTIPPFNPGGAAAVNGFLLEAVSGPATTGTAYCFGDGSGTACPCGNTSTVGANQGCINSLSLGGQLRAIGNSVISADTLTLQGSNVPNGPGLYFQGPVQLSGGAGVVFGDGLRCVGGTVIRLGIVSAAANASTYPFGATPPNNIPIATKGLVTTPGTLNYQLWYRDSAAFCTAAVFNLTNGLSIVWTP